MATIVQCPRCGTGISMPDGTLAATCPKCVRSFKPARKRQNGARSVAESDGHEDESQLPAWISPWGVSAFFLAVLAVFSAMLIGSRFLSGSFAALGLAAIVIGGAATASRRLPRDSIWFLVAGGANVGTLGLIFFAGGLLNPLWNMDAAVAKSDPYAMAALPINQAGVKSRRLGPEDRIDAASEVIQQNDVFLRIMAVQAGGAPERGEQPFLLVQIRLAGRGNERPIVFAGFGKGRHRPKLSDEMGRSYGFVELRKRKLPAGGIVFLPAGPEAAEILSGRFLDYQMVFERAAGEFVPMHLDLPASAWGRNGVCRFRIAGLFDPIVPAPKEN